MNNNEIFGAYVSEEILNEERFGNVSTKTPTAIYVYESESNIYNPHFHVFNNSKGSNNIDACFYLMTPYYFSHTNHTSELKSKDLKILNKYLKTDYKKDRSITI